MRDGFLDYCRLAKHLMTAQGYSMSDAQVKAAEMIYGRRERQGKVVKNEPEEKLADNPPTTGRFLQEKMNCRPRSQGEQVVIKNERGHRSDGLPAITNTTKEAAKSS